MKIKSLKSHTILLIILFSVLALTVLAQANPGTELPSRDYGFYIHIAKQIVKGQLPYVTAWDSKPPAIFYLNAFALRLGRGFRWGVWLVEFAFLFSAIVVSYYLLNKFFGNVSALFGIFIWLWGMNMTLEGGNFTEEYPLTFHFLALLLLFYLIQNPKQRLFNLILGLLFSFSFLFRPNNALIEAITILVYGGTLLWRRDSKSFFHAVMWVSLGIFIPLAATSAYFAYYGQFKTLLEASIIYNLAYSAADVSATSPIKIGFQYLNIVAWIGLIGYILLFIKLSSLKKSPYLPVFLVIVIGSPLMVAFSDLAKRNYGHYYLNWLPFIGVLSAFAFHTIQEKINLPSLKRLPSSTSILFSLLISITVFVLSNGLSKYIEAVDRFFTSSEREARSPISIYVENHTNPDEYVIFWATNPGEYFMSHRNAPYAGLYYPQLVPSAAADRLNEDFLDGLINKKPVLIVDLGRLSIPSLDPVKREEQKAMGVYPTVTPANLDQVLKYIEDNYYLAAVIKNKPIYRLNGTE